MQELKIYRSREKVILNLLLCGGFGILLLIPSNSSHFRETYRLILFFVFAIICIWQMLGLFSKDIKLIIDYKGIALADGERITWKEIGIVKLTEASGKGYGLLRWTEKYYFVEIYARNTEHEQGERLLKKIDATDFSIEVEDISLALKRIANEVNIKVEFNVT